MFDEAGWTLRVDGARVTLENKPLRLLRELLRHPGQAMSKDALLDAVWPGVTVVEGSLTTAMNKLRKALGDSEGRIVETVPGIGYRLAVPVALDVAEPQSALAPVARRSGWRQWAMLAAGAAALAAVGLVLAPPQPVRQPDVLAALRAVDLPALRALVDRGWDPVTPIGPERNSAIGTMLEICEWNPAHDQQKLALAVRLLLDAGARVTDRNVWGDTPYSIAAAPRYCGPDHPATRLLKAVCTGSSARIDPRCLADYAHSDWPQQKTPRLAPATPAG
ncbi:winged helix-turn-helix domain-containing protein [Sandarakinorhabdus oryzae]|uniref:winged helix-turn-helix domain-containing protein n=1 Tax=Sandarakinorhabdus oryzae TaxID=2675220 RepID=UPI0018CC51BF|nr:winged helix-turn-helix domain-containing protein [Sandarakinorhabdus oryzae]